MTKFEKSIPWISLLATSIIGSISYLIIINCFNTCASLAMEADTIASIVSAFSVTMVGFLAVIFVIVYSNPLGRVFQKYKEKGYLPALVSIYYITIILLFLNYCLTLFVIKSAVYVALIISFSIANVCQVLLISFITVKLYISNTEK